MRCAPRLGAGRQLGPLAPLGEPVPEGQAKRAFRLHLPVGFFPADWAGAALATVLLDAQATEARIELEGIDGTWEGTGEVHSPLRTVIYSPQGNLVAEATWLTAPIRSPGQLVWLAQNMEAWSDIWSDDVGGTDAPAAVWVVLNTWLAVGAVDSELREVLELAQRDNIGWKEPVALLDGLADWVRSHHTPADRNAHAWLTEGLLGMVAPEVGLSLAVGAAVLRVVEAARGVKALTKADLDRQDVARRARLIVAADGGDGDALLTCIEGVDPWGVWAQLKERVAGNGWLLGLRLPKWGTGELLPSGWSHWQYAVVPGVGSGRTEARRLRDLFWRDDSHPDSPTPLGLGCFGLDTDPQANRKKVAALADRVARSSGELDTPGKVLDLLLGHHFPLTSVHGSGGVGPTEVHRTERHPVGSLSVVAISFGDGWDVRSDMSSASGAKVLAATLRSDMENTAWDPPGGLAALSLMSVGDTPLPAPPFLAFLDHQLLLEFGTWADGPHRSLADEGTPLAQAILVQIYLDAALDLAKGRRGLVGRYRGFGDSSALERLTKIGTELKEIIQHDRDSPWAAWAQSWLANAGLLLPLDLAEEWSQPVPVPFG